MYVQSCSIRSFFVVVGQSSGKKGVSHNKNNHFKKGVFTMKLLKTGTSGACRRGVQAQKRTDCGGALATGLVKQRFMTPCGQPCRGGGP